MPVTLAYTMAYFIAPVYFLARLPWVFQKFRYADKDPQFVRLCTHDGKALLAIQYRLLTSNIFDTLDKTEQDIKISYKINLEPMDRKRSLKENHRIPEYSASYYLSPKGFVRVWLTISWHKRNKGS